MLTGYVPFKPRNLKMAFQMLRKCNQIIAIHCKLIDQAKNNKEMREIHLSLLRQWVADKRECQKYIAFDVLKTLVMIACFAALWFFV